MARGFKVFYYHPQDRPECNLVESLAHIPDLHTIHLKRQNKLRTLVSKRVADLTQRWTLTRGEKKPTIAPKVAFDPEELLALFKQTQSWEDSAETLFRGKLLLEVYYEDLIEDRDGTFLKITQFLGVHDTHPTTPLIKQDQRPLRDAIENYDQLKQFYTNSIYSTYFAD